MIKLSEDFECEQDRFQWILYEWVDGKDKDKQPKRTRKSSYYSSLYQCCDAVIDRQAGKCNSMIELQNMLKKATAFELVRVLDLPGAPSKRID